MSNDRLALGSNRTEEALVDEFITRSLVLVEVLLLLLLLFDAVTWDNG
jgi:hypothetical protein